MNENNIAIEKSETNSKHPVLDAIKRLICLILPVIFAFLGYFVSPFIWSLLNKSGNAPEYFKLICSLVLFIFPASVIFVETRKLNPIIKITITNKNN